MIKYGFTGTRSGLNNVQRDQIVKLFESNIANGMSIEVHHGDCVGADKELHDICIAMINHGANIYIIIHPPSDEKLRAYCDSINILKPKQYLQRNKDIVDATDILIACPYSDKEIIRSGVWSTIRYAHKKSKEINVIV